MNPFISYLKNVRGELSHVVWPSPRQAFVHLVLIAVISVFAAIFIAGLDYLFTHGVGRLVGAG